MKRILPICLPLLLLMAASIAAVAQPSGSSTPAAYSPQDSTKGDEFYYYKPTFGVGLNVGLFSGAGISGRFMHPNGFGVQGTFFVISAFKYTHVNFGIEGQYAFTRRNDSRFYGIVGFGYYSSVRSDSAASENVIAEPFRVGLGAGYEWFTGDQFAWHIAAALSFMPATSTFFPLPEAGFHFYFR